MISANTFPGMFLSRPSALACLLAFSPALPSIVSARILARLLCFLLFHFKHLYTYWLTWFFPSSFPSALTYLFALPKLPRHRERSHTHLLTLCFFPLVKCTHILVWATQVNLDIVSACILARSLCSAPPCQVRSHTCSHSPSLPRHLER